MLVIAVATACRDHVAHRHVIIMQIVEDGMHRHRRAEKREDEDGEETNGRATHSELPALSRVARKYIPGGRDFRAPAREKHVRNEGRTLNQSRRK